MAIKGNRPTVAVDDLEPGMMLADSVHDAQGRLLIQGGTELTERHLRAFQLWGIMSVRVRGPAGEESAPVSISPEILARAEAQVRARFHNNNLEHPVITALIEACTAREAQRLAEAARHHA